MAPGRPKLITESGEVANTLLKSNTIETVEYDVIVIGSGMGGGVVASALADHNKKVLVLEAGSLLFPTHVGNLPRRLMIGKFQKHIWSLWDNFRVQNYKAPNDVYQGGQAFNLGGRSIFWGSSIPPLEPWELEVWPQEIRDYLLTGNGYNVARGVLNADVPMLEEFHDKAVNVVGGELGAGWIVGPSPVAVEYSGATEWSIPSGIFSTADLLLEDALAENLKDVNPGRQPLTVNLNHAVWDIAINNKKAVGINCHDLLEDKKRTYKAKAVVLSAGTLESAKIAVNSKINNNQIGKGITDHAIYFKHFVVPPERLQKPDLIVPASPNVQPPRTEPQSTKLLLRHSAATKQDHAFDIILELGAQFNQGRFVDSDHIQDDLKVRGGYLLCEIVFQFYADLDDGNTVTLDAAGGHGAQLNVNMKVPKVADHLLLQARQIAGKILRKLDALPVLNDQPLFAADGLPTLEQATVGGVAHEVGTMRMPVNGQPGVVDKDLKVEGHKNLWVCDNSVFPCSPAGNPSLTLVALARRCADSIADYLDAQAGSRSRL